MKKRAYLVTALLMVGILLVPLLGSACPQPAEEKPIVIGMIFDLTGPFAPAGISGSRGAEIAKEVLGTEVAGKSVKFISEDGATDPTTALDKAKKLIETDGACMLLLPLPGASVRAIAPYLEQKKIPGIKLEMTDESVVLGDHWVWLPAGIQEEETYPVGLFAANNLGYKKVAILAWEIGDGPYFMAGFKDGFTESGGTIVNETYYPADTADFGPYVLALQNLDIDAVMGYFPGSNAFGFYDAKANFGLDLPVLEAAGEMPNPPVQAQLGMASVGTVFPATYLASLDTPGNQEFVAAYQDKYQETPSHLSAGAYVIIDIMYQALKATGGDTSSTALSEALNATSVDTIIGTLSFTPEHVGIINQYFYQKVGATGDVAADNKLLATAYTSSEKVGDDLKPVVLEWK